jgi:hypothetical protein
MLSKDKLYYPVDSYVADDQIRCYYCDKHLALYNGSPDLAAADVVCFECYDRLKDNGSEVSYEDLKKRGYDYGK